MTKQCELRRRSKWCGLSYEQCTWELLEDLNPFNAEDARRSVMKYSHLQKLLMERVTKHKRDKNSNATTRPSKPAAIDGHLCLIWCIWDMTQRLSKGRYRLDVL
eukprot:330750_1